MSCNNRYRWQSYEPAVAHCTKRYPADLFGVKVSVTEALDSNSPAIFSPAERSSPGSNRIATNEPTNKAASKTRTTVRQWRTRLSDRCGSEATLFFQRCHMSAVNIGLRNCFSFNLFSQSGSMLIPRAPFMFALFISCDIFALPCTIWT